MPSQPAHNFKTTFRDRRLGYLLRVRRDRAPGLRPRPETIVLDVAPDGVPSGKPPVRIYVGTEAAQFRAERVLVWSIMQHADRSRRYEIHLMKDLAGFDRHRWKTGFTRYRYAVPELAGKTGRAIYNDVDQIYLADPAELFDLGMQGKGQLGIDERENSVMLLDCAAMARVWRAADAQNGQKHKPFREAVHAAGLWGPLPGVWNARDGEYVPGQSKLLHFTTLQTQPWRPFPRELHYHEHPLSQLWHGLERAADAAGFTLFSKQRPSQRFAELLALNRDLHAHGNDWRAMSAEDTFRGKSLREHVGPIARLIERHGARTILDYGSGKAKLYDAYPGEPAGSRRKTMRAWGGAEVTCFDPGYGPFAGPIADAYDGVICTDVLEHVADDDVPWILDELCGRARSFVYAAAACYPARKTLPDGTNAHVTLQPPEWWREQLASAGRRRPGVAWVLCVQQSRHGRLLGTERIYRGGGGR